MLLEEQSWRIPKSTMPDEEAPTEAPLSPNN